MRTAIILGAIIVSSAINNFKPFPTGDVSYVIGLLLVMIVWDLVTDVFK